MRKLLRRVYYLLNRRRLERELAEEMAAHREMLGGGRRAAFGSQLKIREDARDVWAWTQLDRFWQDLAYAARVFRRSPGFTSGAVAVLSLGIGANLAEFHILDAVMIHRLNLPGVESIYQFAHNSKDRSAPAFSAAEVKFLRENCSVCAYALAEHVNYSLVIDSDPELRGNFVTSDYFSSLNVLPAWGRLLDEQDFAPDAPPVAVLSYEYWQKHWGSDPGAVGKTIHINGKLVEIAGVAPYDFFGFAPQSVVVWLPVGLRSRLVPDYSPSDDSTHADLQLFVRGKPGIGLQAMEDRLTALDRQFHKSTREERLLGSRLPGSGFVPRQAKAPLFLMLVMVGLVLASACANLGNMLLARGFARQREIDIRMALGAGRKRVVRQLMTESLLLASMGALAGLGVGYVAAKLLVRALDAPPDIRIGVHWDIVAIGVVLTFLAVVLFGLPAALHAAGPKHKSGRRCGILVGVQVAVSSLLLICSGVLTSNALRSANVELAFDFPRMISVYLGGRAALPVRRAKIAVLMSRLEQLPAVAAVTSAVYPPLGQRFATDTLPGLPTIYMNMVAPNYFAAMGIPLLRGRAFKADERNAAIVSETAARIAWPNQDPIGKIWNIENAQRAVVGVVKDSGANLLIDADSIEAYIPIEGDRADVAVMIVRARGEVSQVVRAIPLLSDSLEQTLAAVPMPSSRARLMDGQSKVETVLGALGAIATLLAAAGMFAMVAFAVAQRTRELGIRIAIGAQPPDILRTLLEHNLMPIGVGTLTGALLGIALGRAVGSIVQIVQDPLDPRGFAFGVAAFVLVAAGATLVPAFRALRIDPSSTLRYE